MIEKLQNLQFELIRMKDYRKELVARTNENYMARKALEKYSDSADISIVIEDLLTERTKISNEHNELDSEIEDIECRIYKILGEAEDEGIKFDIVMNPGWVYVFKDGGVK